MNNLIKILLVSVTVNTFANELPSLPFGRATTLNAEKLKITLDYSIVKKFCETEDVQLLKENFWELIYFVNLGDELATKSLMRFIAKNLPDDFLHDQLGAFLIARAVSQSELFWLLIYEIDQDLSSRLLKYYKKNPDFYENIEGFDFMYSDFIKSKKNTNLRGQSNVCEIKGVRVIDF